MTPRFIQMWRNANPKSWSVLRAKLTDAQQSVFNKTLNSQSKLFVASKKGEGQHLSSVFLSFSNYRMRGLLVGFHFYPVLLSGVALFLVAFSSSLHTDLSRDEVFERVEGNTWMCYTSQHSDIFFRRDVNVSSAMSENSNRMAEILAVSR